MSTASLTYVEIAARFGVTTASARNLVRRKGWPKTLGNDGLARIVVPSDAIPDEPLVRGEGSTVQPSQSVEGSTVQPSEEPHLTAMAMIERHVERLEAEIVALKTKDETHESERARVALQVGALQATLVAVRENETRLRDERDQLLTRLMTRPPWYAPWRRSA